MHGFLTREIAFLTRHGKEQVVSPLLNQALGCSVVHVDGFDTDLLGTFTRDVQRPGSQLEAARRKALKGMELAGLSIGLASEGSFGPDPVTGMFVWNVELLLLIDAERQLEIAGMAQQPGRSEHILTASWDSVQHFAIRAGFPDHHLVVRPEHQDDPRLVKGIANWEALEQVFAHAQSLSANGEVFLENDLRAHTNPTRMHTIRLAAENLAARIQSTCPNCAMPGFWGVEAIAGLPCRACGAPTHKTKAVKWACQKCALTETRAVPGDAFAGSESCDLCNP